MENLRKKFIICKTITTDDYDLGWNIFNHICNNPEAVKEFNDHSAFDNYCWDFYEQAAIAGIEHVLDEELIKL